MRGSLALLILFAGAGEARAQFDPWWDPDPEPVKLLVSPRVSVFFSGLNGRVQADQGASLESVAVGTPVRFDADLHIDDTETLGLEEVRLYSKTDEGLWERHTLSMLRADFGGLTSLEADEIFNGHDFLAGDTIESQWRYRMYGWDWGSEPTTWGGRARVQGVFGLRWTEYHIRLDQGSGDTDERLRLLWAGAGGRADFPLTGRISVDLRAGAYFSMPLGPLLFDDPTLGDDWFGLHGEASAGLKGRWGNLSAEIGLRIVSSTVSVEEDGLDRFERNDFSFVMGGPFVALEVRF